MSKLCTLKEAISNYVHDGDTVYCAGFTHLIPFAAGHEIIRQGRRNLTLARATPDLIYDQMVAAGAPKNDLFLYRQPRCGLAAHRPQRTRSRTVGMGGILPFWHDLPPAGRRCRAALHPHEPDRRPRSWKATIPISAGSKTPIPAAKW